MELSAEDKKRLRAEHPLFTRLSGDVVWGLLEETGFDPEACEAMMDEVLGSMQRALRVMATVECGAPGFVIQVEDDACPHAAMLDKCMVPASGPWQSLLPPYAVGCAVSCTAAGMQDAPEQGAQLPLRPKCGLVCPLLSAD